MKKLLSLLLAVILILVLCSCGKTDYTKLCYTYLQEEIIPETGMRSGNIPDVDMRSMNWDGYKPEKGLVFSLVEDMSGDGVPELITGEETECDDFFGDDDTKNSAILIKAYGISDDEIVFIDETEIEQLLPLFSFVDITFKDKTLFVSGIGAWAGDPPFNDHYIIKLDDGKLVQEKLSTMDMFITIPPEDLTDDEKDVVYGTLKKLQNYGFDYEDIYDITGGYNPSATRLAFYSLFGEEGRSAEYFDGDNIPDKKLFYDYTRRKK
ncbi:MAG: hypothetical protein IJY55_02645 [Clostridia bacterium]|nr:hypothetical protein [Clostridia bacterium]